MLWKVNGNKLSQIADTFFSEQHFQERDLESWIESNVGILGESLLIIGRQVVVPGVNDRLDLLALDPSGNTVIIEIKRGTLNDPVDMQALRYASYISRWPRRKIEEMAEAYFAQRAGNGEGASFEEAFAEFTADTDSDMVPSLNGQQRIIVVGQKVQNRLGSTALWLRKQGIDIKIIEITPFEDPAGQGLILSPQVIIPPPSIEEFEVGKKDATDPWIVDGESWHLEQRCKQKGKQLVLKFIQGVQDHFRDVQGPHWGQKQYISFRLGNAIWLRLITKANQLNVDIPVPTERWQSAALAERLGIAAASKDDSLAERLSAPTSVDVYRRQGRETIRFFIKESEPLTKDAFWKLLTETHNDFLKGW